MSTCNHNTNLPLIGSFTLSRDAIAKLEIPMQSICRSCNCHTSRRFGNDALYGVSYSSLMKCYYINVYSKREDVIRWIYETAPGARNTLDYKYKGITRKQELDMMQN